MAQVIRHSYFAPATTIDLNQHIEDITRQCVAEGMTVSQSGNWQVTIGPGVWIRDGCSIQETTSVSTPLTIAAPSSQPRIDIVYGQYTYSPESPPPTAIYGVKQGTPGANPVPPSLEANQVELCQIYIPPTASTLEDCTFKQALKLKDQLEMLLNIQIEGNVWVRPDDPRDTIPQYVEDGDFWLDTDTKTLYVWDAPSEQWVPPTIPVHAPTHSAGGVDPIDVKNLADSNKYLRNGTYHHYATRAAHNQLGIDHSSLTNVQPDQHHARDHASRHMPGGADAIAWGHGNGTDADTVDSRHASEFALANHSHEYEFAPTPHGNAHHSPAFSPEGHTHPLSDISGVEAIMMLGPVQLATDTVPSGTFYEKYIPNLAIAGTTVKIYSLIVRVATAPSGGNITFTFRQNAVGLGNVTIPAGQTLGQLDLNPPVALAAADILSIVGPTDARGAKGVDAFFYIKREAA